MLYIYSIADQTVEVGAPIQFTTIGVRKGQSAFQTTETTETLFCPGIYEVSFNGTAAAATTAQLYLNGEAVQGALSEGTSLAFTTLVPVNPNCCAVTNNLPARLQVLNEGAAATFNNVALTVVKVG